MPDLALELNPSHLVGLRNRSSCSTGAVKMGRRALVLEAILCCLLCAARSAAEHGGFTPVGGGGMKTALPYSKGVR